MSEQIAEVTKNQKAKLGQTIQVRLVSDLKKSQEYYRNVLGCNVDDWGHAERDNMVFILQQAVSTDDARPNSVSKSVQIIQRNGKVPIMDGTHLFM